MAKQSLKLKKSYEANEDEATIQRIKEFIDLVEDYEDDQRALSRDDFNFLYPGGHWSDDDRRKRKLYGRPCLETDRLNPLISQILNEQRQNRPQPSVNPCGSGADKETAEVLQGMLRHIMYQSDGDLAIDTAYDQCVKSGRGFIRVITDYTDDGTGQEIRIERIIDPFSVYLDPTRTDPVGSDSKRAAITTWITKEQFMEEYPDAKMSDIDSKWDIAGQIEPAWVDNLDGSVKIVEYFERKQKMVDIAKLQVGIEMELPEVPEELKGQIISTRKVRRWEVTWTKATAMEILSSGRWPGKYIPIVPVLGSEHYRDGKLIYSGITRTAKDASRMIDYFDSSIAEMVALAPKAPYLAPLGSIVDEETWNKANSIPVQVLYYNQSDPISNAPFAPPSREIAEPPIMAINAAAQRADQNFKAVTGMWDAVQGRQESGQSGVAIKQLQRQGQITNFHYQDNLSKSGRHLGRVIIDLMSVYSPGQIVRTINPDGSAKQVTLGVEHVDEEGKLRIYDVAVGNYDVTVSTGPSYQTKRQEGLALLESLSSGPFGAILAQIAPDQVFSLMDFDVANTITERAKTLPAVQQAINAAKQQAKNGQATPQDMQQNQQNQQNQQMQQMQQELQNRNALIQQLQQGQQAKAQAAQTDASIKMQIAKMNNQVEMAKAKLQADTELRKTEMQLSLKAHEDAMKTQGQLMNRYVAHQEQMP